MFLHIRMISVIKFHTRRFHFTSKTFLRQIVPKTSVEHKDLNSNFNSSSIRQSTSTDYLGVESDEGVISVNPQKHCSPHTVRTTRKAKEKFYNATFGVVRYDSDNRLKFHGQYGDKLDFTFPHSSSEGVEVSKSSPKSSKNQVDNKVQSLNYSKTSLVNDKLKNSNCDPKSLKKNDQDLNYIDENYFGSYETEIFSHNNHSKEVALEELNLVDKDFITLTTSENPSIGEQNSSKNSISKEEEDTIFDEKDQYVSSKNNNINDVATDELSFLDKMYFEDLTVSEKNSINEEFSKSSSCSKKIPHYSSSSDVSELNHAEIVDKDFKPNDNKNVKANDLLISSTTSFVENSNLFENTSDNQMYVRNYDEGKNRSVIECNIEHLELNEFNKSNNDNVRQKTKKGASQHNFENSRSSLKMLKTDLISKENVHPPVSHINSAISDELHTKAVESFAYENNFKYSRPASEEPNQDDEVSTAHDFVAKLREKQKIPLQTIKKGKGKAGEKFDSKGFLILKNQVDDLSYFTREEIFTILKQNIIYSDDDLLVLNKPYSLVIHESQTTNSPCLSMFLDDLAKEMDRQSTNPKLFTVHRLDKETTGCLLLARNETMAQNLKSLFAQRKIIKKYWIITSGVPDPIEGVINIPISEGSINNRKRMVLHPNLPKDVVYRSHSRNGKPAVTSYKVLSTSGNAALVEATPVTGIKHQIRVHFGFGLGCPILGDHKYSHLDKLVPQKLPSDMLQRLHVRQSKVRYIPMHIHAKSVEIPEYFERRNLLVNIPLPNYMKLNLKRLKFRKKEML